MPRESLAMCRSVENALRRDEFVAVCTRKRLWGNVASVGERQDREIVN